MSIMTEDGRWTLPEEEEEEDSEEKYKIKGREGGQV
jgi:hypothetical protein